MYTGKFINEYLMDLRPYRTVSQEIWSTAPEKWGGILKLDWNEATVEPAPQVRDAVVNFAASRDFFHLYPSTFNKRLMELLAQYAGVPEMNVQYFASSDSLHEYIARLYIGRGDRVMVLWPSYDNFRSTAEGSGAEIVYMDMGEDFRLDLGHVKECLERERPKLAYICNPNNPTGHLIAKDQVREIISGFPETMFLVDEAYGEFAHQSVNDLAPSFGNLLVSHTMSKAFGLANIRFGYLVSCVDNIDAISRIRNPKSVPTLTQVAVTAALENQGYMWDYVEEVGLAREQFLSRLQEGCLAGWVRAYPSAANFVLLRCRDISTRSTIYYALREKGIYVRQLGQSASVLDCIRITVGTREQMERVYRALCDALSGR